MCSTASMASTGSIASISSVALTALAASVQACRHGQITLQLHFWWGNRLQLRFLSKCNRLLLKLLFLKKIAVEKSSALTHIAAEIDEKRILVTKCTKCLQQICRLDNLNALNSLYDLTKLNDPNGLNRLLIP